MMNLVLWRNRIFACPLKETLGTGMMMTLVAADAWVPVLYPLHLQRFQSRGRV